MKGNYLVSVVIVISLLAICNTVSFSQPVGNFENHQDIGTNVKPASATYIPATNQYVISGAGCNIWGDHDECQFVYKKMKGNFIVYARAEFLRPV